VVNRFIFGGVDVRRYIVAITGASGVIYGIRLLEYLLTAGMEVHLVISQAACLVLEQEMGWDFASGQEDVLRGKLPPGHLYFYDNKNLAAKIASGSFLHDGMIIVPCTMATLAAVAQGSSGSLIERAADVALKEKNRLVLVPRETPLNLVHLRNMLQAAEAGAHLIPAMPAFYHNPLTIDEMVWFMVGKILDSLKIEHQLYSRYEGKD